MREELLDETPLVIKDRSGIVYTDPDLKVLDDLLANVSMRNSVYAKEIFDHLPDNPYSAIVVEELKPFVATVHEDSLLHCRDFLNPLLDYRNYLTQDAPVEPAAEFVVEVEVRELEGAS